MEKLDKFLLENPEITQDVREDIMETVAAILDNSDPNTTTISGYNGNTPISVETENLIILIQIK